MCIYENHWWFSTTLMMTDYNNCRKLTSEIILLNICFINIMLMSPVPSCETAKFLPFLHLCFLISDLLLPYLEYNFYPIYHLLVLSKYISNQTVFYCFPPCVTLAPWYTHGFLWSHPLPMVMVMVVVVMVVWNYKNWPFHIAIKE